MVEFWFPRMPMLASTCSNRRASQFRSALTAVKPTFRDCFPSLPRGIIIQQLAKRDLDMRMVFPNALEHLGRFLKGQDYEQVLGFAVWSPSHCEGGSKLGEA